MIFIASDVRHFVSYKTVLSKVRLNGPLSKWRFKKKKYDHFQNKVFKKLSRNDDRAVTDVLRHLLARHRTIIEDNRRFFRLLDKLAFFDASF